MKTVSSPVVSVVIPTFNRPELVVRGVQSVLAQTFKEFEIIVVIDGNDPKTVGTLETITDPRLRIISREKNSGPSAARNFGVTIARGSWIAFLDDDDEWLPQKLERQMDLIARSSNSNIIVTSLFIARTPKGEVIWPRRIVRPNEPIGDYLFVRNSFFLGEGFIQTSTLLIQRNLLLELPLGNHLSRHEDWDWLLRATKLYGVEVRFVEEPLAIWYSEVDRKRLSNLQDWQYSFQWVKAEKPYISRQAYSSFVMTVVAPQAASQLQWHMFFPLLSHAIQHGSPRSLDYMLYFLMWIMPAPLRQKLRALSRFKLGGSSAG